MKVELIGIALFFLGAVVLATYTFSVNTPMPRLTILGKITFVLSSAGTFLSMIGFVIGWAKPEGGSLMMVLSAAVFVIGVAISFNMLGR